MTNPYGPWATAINAGRNPQLSASWRQRLTMLVPTSQTSPVLSRRLSSCSSRRRCLRVPCRLSVWPRRWQRTGNRRKATRNLLPTPRKTAPLP